MNIADVKKMSIAERIQAMETIWDSLLYDEMTMESPKWHQDVLNERQRKVASGNAEYLSIEELKSIHSQ